MSYYYGGINGAPLDINGSMGLRTLDTSGNAAGAYYSAGIKRFTPQVRWGATTSPCSNSVQPPYVFLGLHIRRLSNRAFVRRGTGPVVRLAQHHRSARRCGRSCDCRVRWHWPEQRLPVPDCCQPSSLRLLF